MKFQEIAAALGIETYPQIMDSIYQNLEKERVDICDTAFIEKLEQEYGLFGKHFDAVIAGAKAVAADPIRRAWGETSATAIKTGAVQNAREIPTPDSDETIGADMLPLLVLLPLLPQTAELYRKMGFPEEEVRNVIRSFGDSIDFTQARTGRPGYNRDYYGWQALYLDGSLFRFQSFNYELRTLIKPHEAVYILKNRTSGELVPVMNGARYHRSGMLLGSAGFEDEEGSFETPFTETEDAYIGYPAIDNLVVNQAHTYPKAQWECVLQPGDNVISVHIPKATDLSPEAVEESYRKGMAFVNQYFPDFKPKCYYCKSWLLDPHLEEILGKGSKITKFMQSFTKYPGKSGGKEVFSFVFTGFDGELKDLPENTSLERGIKARYLDGKHIHGYAGVLFL